MYGRIASFLILLYFLISCNKYQEEPAHQVIGFDHYKVSDIEFYKEKEKLIRQGKVTNEKEIATSLFDNYISAGLLIESARKKNYQQKKEFKERFNCYEEHLMAWYSKYSRVKNVRVPAHLYNNLEKYYSNEVKIDYIRIPKEHRNLVAFIIEKFKSGIYTYDLLNSNDIMKWNELGLSFYENISIESALLTQKILDKIIQMNEGDVEVIKTKSAYHIVRFIKRFHKINTGIDKQQVLLNLKMAYALDNGDYYLDKYSLNRLIKCNNELLLNIDFSIPSYSVKDGDNSLANLFGIHINEKEVMEKVCLLPLNIQSLFKNKSTRIRALSALVLINYSNNLKISRSHFNTSAYLELINKQIGLNPVQDTVEFLENWLNHELIQNNINSIPEILNIQIHTNNQSANELNHIHGPIITNKNQSPILQKQISFWLHPEKIPGFDSLKLNYKAIGNMKFTEKEITNKDLILAYADNWRLTIRDFEKALDNLTPYTRLYMVKNDNIIEMIKYIAKDEASINSNIKINTSLLKLIDIIGHSFDSIKYVGDEEDVVGSLDETVITVSALRDYINNLSKDERTKFENKESRMALFSEIIIDKFFIDQNSKTEEVENDSLFQNKIVKYENWLLVQWLYKSEIQVTSIELGNDKLNIHLKKAVKAIDHQRLKKYLQNVSIENKINVNKKILSKLGVDFNLSNYASVIQDTN